MRHALAALLLVLASTLAHPQQYVTPPPTLELDGVPPIPAALERASRPYGEFRTHALLSWHPKRREMLVRARLHETAQVHQVSVPGTRPRPLTDLPDAVEAATFEPVRGGYFLYWMGGDGDEVHRLYRHDLATGQSTALSPAGERASRAAFDRTGRRIVFTTSVPDRDDPHRSARTAVHVMEPLRPRSSRVVARFDRGTWQGFRFSDDGRRLVFVEYASANESHLWTLDLVTGRKRRITRPAKDGPVFYGNPSFTRDGRGILAVSDRGSEFRRLVRIPSAGGTERVLTAKLPFDVDDVEVSRDANLVAFLTNENGAHVLRFLDATTLEELPRPPLVDGVIGGLEWRPGSSEIGFHISSARSALDVFSYDVKENRLTRWTNGNNPQVSALELVEPRLARWKSFDGLEITALRYQPPKRFEGRRPVLVQLHGGPELQARPAFLGRYNYLVNELGIAIVQPNVRGSSGFGKSFLRLDDGRHREDAVKDVASLLDWIAAQPGLDPSRVLVMGRSYGGYLALATLAAHSDRIAGAVSVAGISSFVTFLESTAAWRREVRRAEYGDERDPSMRAYLESISPLGGVERMSRPLLIAHGRNDPRVRESEARQIAASLKARGAPAWWIAAPDEGHGFARRQNADYLFLATVEFARRVLLPEATSAPP